MRKAKKAEKNSEDTDVSICEIEGKMPKDAAKEMNIIETILGINKETVQHVYADLVKPLKINSKMVMTLLHYARIIRPCQRECINEVLEMINKNFQINQTKIYIYIYMMV